jgi:hypothetical protein
MVPMNRSRARLGSPEASQDRHHSGLIEQTWQGDGVSSIDPSRATTFGGWAAEYDRWRPTYPDDAVTWLLPPEATHVAEVGAGTGKLTDRLVERGLQLDVVEPDVRMLNVVCERHPSVRTHPCGRRGCAAAGGFLGGRRARG